MALSISLRVGPSGARPVTCKPLGIRVYSISNSSSESFCMRGSRAASTVQLLWASRKSRTCAWAWIWAISSKVSGDKVSVPAFSAALKGGRLFQRSSDTFRSFRPLYSPALVTGGVR